MNCVKLHLVLLQISLACLATSVVNSADLKSSLDDPIEEKCLGLETFSLDMCEHIKSQRPNEHYERCKQNSICQKQFHVSFVNTEPYSSELFRKLVADHIIKKCCGNCNKTTTIHMFKNMSEVNRRTINSSHMIYPILGQSDIVRMYGYYFVPVIDVPCVYYITAKQEEVMRHFVYTTGELWPLLVIGSCMTVIAGFLAWLFETWGNIDEFPREFLGGWFEGFWWSFISVTTVGYGDKAPKSIMARLFAVIWILVGITIFSMLTASLTAAIRNASTLTPEIAGRKIGGLQYRAFDASVIAQYGGILVEIDEEDFTGAIIKMVKMLTQKEINGFLMDQYTFVQMTLIMRNIDAMADSTNTSKEWLEMARFFLHKTMRNKKTYFGQELSYGILMKHEQDYLYFRDYITDNRHIIATCKKLNLNMLLGEFDNPKTALFDPSSNYFLYSLYAAVVFIVLIVFFGLLFESYRTQTSKDVKYTKCVSGD